MSIPLPLSLIIGVFKSLFILKENSLTDERFHDASKFPMIFSLSIEMSKVWMVLEWIKQTIHVMNVTEVFSSIKVTNAPEWNVAMRDRWSGYFQTWATHTPWGTAACRVVTTAAECLLCPPDQGLLWKQDSGWSIPEPCPVPRTEGLPRMPTASLYAFAGDQGQCPWFQHFIRTGSHRLHLKR